MMQYSALASVYDLFSDHDPSSWAEYIVSLLQEHQVNPGSRIIDAACGTGGITIELFKRGYMVTGLDASQEMLSVAAEKAISQGCRIIFVCQDMARIRVHRGIDAIVSTCDCVNYLKSEAQLKGFIGGCSRGLRSGGLLLFDISSSAKLRAMEDQFYAEEMENAAYLWSNAYSPEDKLLSMDITFFIKQEQGELFRREREIHTQRVWETEDIGQVLTESGFDWKCFEAFTRQEPTQDSQRIQFVAVKN